MKERIEEELRRKGKFGNSIAKIVSILNDYMKKLFVGEEENKEKDIFSFLYKIILYIAFSDS